MTEQDPTKEWGSYEWKNFFDHVGIKDLGYLRFSLEGDLIFNKESYSSMPDYFQDRLKNIYEIDKSRKYGYYEEMETEE